MTLLPSANEFTKWENMNGILKAAEVAYHHHKIGSNPRRKKVLSYSAWLDENPLKYTAYKKALKNFNQFLSIIKKVKCCLRVRKDNRKRSRNW